MRWRLARSMMFVVLFAGMTRCSCSDSAKDTQKATNTICSQAGAAARDFQTLLGVYPSNLPASSDALSKMAQDLTIPSPYNTDAPRDLMDAVSDAATQVQLLRDGIQNNHLLSTQILGNAMDRLGNVCSQYQTSSDQITDP